MPPLFHYDVWRSAFEPLLTAMICGLIGVGVPSPKNRFSIISNMLAALGLGILIHLTFFYCFRGEHRLEELILCALAGFGGAPLFDKLRDAIWIENFKEALKKWLLRALI